MRAASLGVLNIIAILDGFYLALDMKGCSLLQEARSGDKHVGFKRLAFKVWLASSLLSLNYPINREKMKYKILGSIQPTAKKNETAVEKREHTNKNT